MCEQVLSARDVSTVMDTENPRRNTRRFRKFLPGDEVNLCLRFGLSRDLGPAAAARIQELRAQGVDRLPVQVVKAPRVVPGAEDAVEVEAPDLVGTIDPMVYVRVEFLELPIPEPPGETHCGRVGHGQPRARASASLASFERKGGKRPAPKS